MARPLVLALTLIGLCGAGMACAQATSDSAQWYGATIDAEIPSGTGPVDDRIWKPSYPAPTYPAPWSGVYVEAEEGRIAALSFFLEEDIVLSPYYRPSRGIRPDRSAEFYAGGLMARDHTVARLGKPSKLEERTDRLGRTWATLTWDYIPRFKGCDGETPILTAAATEPSGKLAKVELAYDENGVRLRIWGTKSGEWAVYGPTADQEKRVGLDHCKAPASAKGNDVVGDIGKGLDAYCKDNPDKCVTTIPGVTILPAPGVTVVPAPCPRGTKKSVSCYAGREKDEPAPAKPAE